MFNDIFFKSIFRQYHQQRKLVESFLNKYRLVSNPTNFWNSISLWFEFKSIILSFEFLKLMIPSFLCLESGSNICHPNFGIALNSNESKTYNLGYKNLSTFSKFGRFKSLENEYLLTSWFLRFRKFTSIHFLCTVQKSKVSKLALCYRTK